MANSVHVERLREGARAWNAWRERHPGIVPDLSGLDLPIGLRQFGPAQGGPVDLSGADLSAAALEQATLIEANLAGARLVGADLSHARLEHADLSGADLGGADFDQADLKGAKLDGASLAGAGLGGARNLSQAQIERATGDRATVLPAGLTAPREWLLDAAVTRVNDTGKRGAGEAVQSNDPHLILGVGRRASTREIRAAYLRLVKELHPDGRAPGPRASEADERLKRINDAYQELKGFGPRASARKAERRSSARRTGALFVFGVLSSGTPLLVVLGFGAYYAGWLGGQEPPRTAALRYETVVVSQKPRDVSAEREAAWTEAQKLATREVLQRFVAAYPEGEPAAQARQMLAEIERGEARQREERAEEQTAWAAAAKAGTREELERYVAAYPAGTHAGEARQVLAALEVEAARKAEEAAAWAMARKAADTADKVPLQRFLAAYPDGPHGAEARRMLAAIERAEAQAAERARAAERAVAAAEAQRKADLAAWAEADANGAKSALEGYVTAFPDGRFTADARERLALLEAEEREDETAWLKAERRPSKAAYAGYLTAHPRGRRATDARLRLAELERAEVRPPLEPARAPAGPPVGRPRAPEAVLAPRWPAADEPFIGADGRIRR